MTTEQLQQVLADARARQSSTTATAQSFNTAKAARFLDQVFGDVSTGLISISYITHAGRVRSESFQWIRSAVARAAEWDQERPMGTYFRCTALSPEGVKGGRGGADDAHCLPFLWADLDFGDIGHKAGRNQLPLPPTRSAAQEIISGLPAPTLTVHSGGGLYPLWRFERPVYLTTDNRAEAKVRSENWQKIIVAEANRRGWHYGPVGDLARILRLPGSINRKEKSLERPCRVIEWTGRVYPW